MNKDTKILNKILQTVPSQIKKKKDYIPLDQVRFSPGIQGWFNISKLINTIHYINRLKETKQTHDHLKFKKILKIKKTHLG